MHRACCDRLDPAAIRQFAVSGRLRFNAHDLGVDLRNELGRVPFGKPTRRP